MLHTYRKVRHSNQNESENKQNNIARNTIVVGSRKLDKKIRFFLLYISFEQVEKYREGESARQKEAKPVVARQIT